MAEVPSKNSIDQLQLATPQEETPENFFHTLRVSAADHSKSRTAFVLTLAQLQKLADDFDLGRIIKMEAPLDTQCNTTDPFRTGQGMFLLRARHAEEYVERLEFLHRVIDSLVASGFPCPSVIRSRKGKSWTIWGERLVEIHQFIAHDPGSHRDMSRMLAASGLLADLHRALRKATEGKTVIPPEMRNDLSPRQMWVLLQNITAKVEVAEKLSEDGPLALEVAHRAGSSLAPMLKDYERIVGEIPWTVVHGDYHFWNLLYRGDQVVAVVDYDFMQERERLFDLAYALQSLVAYLRQVHIGTLTDYAQLRWKSARLWVDLYDEGADMPLTPLERQILAGEVMRIYLVSLLTSASQGDPCEVLVSAADELEIYRWLGQHPEIFI